MPKSANQKLKILYIRDLLEHSDPNHLVTMTDIRECLEAHGITAERKSIYSDLSSLSDYGLQIETVPGRNGGYYLKERTFELPELKLLTDAVLSSKFITTKKSRELVKKLETLAGEKDAKKLNRQIVVSRRNKTENENIYQNVDLIHTAISENARISFQYFEWTVSKTMKLRRNGQQYHVSPWFLNWDDENYYLIAYDDEEDIVKHFRVDKMLGIRILDEKRRGKEKMADLDLAEYTQRIFGMFTGEEETVILDCDNSLIGVIIDRFGTEISVRPSGSERFRARMKVAVSPHFYGWVSGFGGRILIVSPESVRKDYISFLKGIEEKYN